MPCTPGGLSSRSRCVSTWSSCRRRSNFCTFREASAWHFVRVLGQVCGFFSHQVQMEIAGSSKRSAVVATCGASWRTSRAFSRNRLCRSAATKAACSARAAWAPRLIFRHTFFHVCSEADLLICNLLLRSPVHHHGLVCVRVSVAMLENAVRACSRWRFWECQSRTIAC